LKRNKDKDNNMTKITHFTIAISIAILFALAAWAILSLTTMPNTCVGAIGVTVFALSWVVIRQCTNTDVAADAALKEARYDEWRRAQDEVEK